MNFNQKFEPEGNKIIHGAGQSPEQFKKYCKAVEDCKPSIYMLYVRINEIKEKIDHKIKEIPFSNLLLQIGLNLKIRNNGEVTEEVFEGKLDSEILYLIKAIKKYKNPVFLRIGYEFNNPHHNYSPEKFILAWKYLVDFFRKNKVKNVAFVWDACTAFNRNIKEVMIFYPGDNYVDWFGDNLFSSRCFTELNNPKIITKDFLKKSIEHKKPLMIGECSPARTGVDKGIESWNEWFKPFFLWIEKHPNIKAFCYINWDWGKDWKMPEWLNGRIEENEEVRVRYVRELKNPKYINSTSLNKFLKKIHK